jgi:predicted Zn-dependent protease
MLDSLKAIVKGGLRVLGTLVGLAVFAFVLAASCWVRTSPSTSDSSSTLQYVEIDTSFPSHRAILSSLLSACSALTDDCLTDLVIAQSDEVNAASFGGGRYVFWEGAAAVEDSVLDAITAHEVAHDLLLHSRRSHDSAALLAFIAEVIGIVGGASREDEGRIRDWLEGTALPQYSRKYEFQADAKALEILRDMGYEEPTRAMAATMRLPIKRYGDSGGRFTDSHPATSERLRRIATH